MYNESESHVAIPNVERRSVDGLITLHMQRQIDKSLYADCMVRGLTADGVFGWFQAKPTKREYSIALRIRVLGNGTSIRLPVRQLILMPPSIGGAQLTMTVSSHTRRSG
jgi:hypothetical protein